MGKQMTVEKYYNEYHDGHINGRPLLSLWLKGQTVSHISKTKNYYRLQLSDGTTEVLREWELVTTD